MNRRRLFELGGSLTLATLGHDAIRGSLGRSTRTGSLVTGDGDTNTPARDVRDYGAKGDGNADDSDAFHAAVAALPDGGGTIMVPDGIYKIGSSIALKARPERDARATTRIGVRMAANAVLAYHGPRGSSCFDVSSQPGQDGSVTIEGGMLDGVAAPQTTGVRVAIPNVVIRRTIVRRFEQDGIRFDPPKKGAVPPIRCVIDTCELFLNGVGLRADATKVHGLQLLGTWVESNNREGVVLGDCGHVTWTGGGCEGNGYLDPSAPNLRVLGDTSFHAFGTYFESNENQDHSIVVLDASATRPFLSASFHGCLFAGYLVGHSVAIDAGPSGRGDLASVSVQDCLFGETKTGVRIGPRVKYYDVGSQTMMHPKVASRISLVEVHPANRVNGGRGRVASQPAPRSDAVITMAWSAPLWKSAIAINAHDANWFVLEIHTAGRDFEIASPTGGNTGQQIVITIRNRTKGAMGKAVFASVFRCQEFHGPADGHSTSAHFAFTGRTWQQTSPWLTVAD